MKKLIIISLTLILLFCLSIIYGSKNELQGSRTRVTISLPNEKLREIIKKETKGMNVKEILDYCNKITSKLLHFSPESKLRSLELLSVDKPIATHCVGYAKAYTSICNYAFKINQISYKCYHKVGAVSFLGLDLTNFASNIFKFADFEKVALFFKDHDFVLVEKSNGEVITLDPTAYDLFGFNWRRSFYYNIKENIK